MRAPSHWKLDDLYEHCLSGPKASKGDKWFPARPCGFYSIWSRIRIAYSVFIGKCDAVEWPGDQ